MVCKSDIKSVFCTQDTTFGGRYCFGAPGGAHAPDTQKGNGNNALRGARTRFGLQKCTLSAQGNFFRGGTCFCSQKCISGAKMQKVASRIVAKALVFLAICGPGRPSAQNWLKVILWPRNHLLGSRLAELRDFSVFLRGKSERDSM